MAITIQEVLKQISQSLYLQSETPSLDGQVLVGHILEKSRSWVLAHPETLLDDQQHKNITHALHRLKNGEALPYILEYWEFFGLKFHLTSDVLIPRPETELLVERGINWLHHHPRKRKAIDVGTGSGCIGIALAKNIPDLNILLTDISPMALNVARVNAEKFGLVDRLEFKQADLLEGIAGQYDLICANLPYIPRHVLKELPVAVKEPLLALDGGQSGVELIVRLLDLARNRLEPGGLMLLEIEASQGTEVMTRANEFYPAAKVELLKDLSGLDRCVEIALSNRIIHLCQRKQWFAAQKQGIFISQALSQEGFIHCSQPEQILQVANRFYQGIPGLVLLWIDPEKITSEIRWETADGSIFPHIYGPINLDAVISVVDLLPDMDGIYRFFNVPD